MQLSFQSKLNVILVFSFTILFGVIGVLQGIDLNWDLMNYHYYNAYSFFEDRIAYDVAPAQVQTYINPLFDFLTYFLIRNFSDSIWIIVFVLGAVHGTSGFILYKISQLFFSGYQYGYIYIFLSLVIGLTGAAGFTLIGSTMTGWESSIFVLASLYLLLRADTRFPEVFFSGLFIGIGVGGKLTNAIFLIGISISILHNSSSLKSGVKSILIYLAGASLGLLVSTGFWFYILYINFDSPVFPFFNNFINSEWAAAGKFNDERFLPRDLFQFLFYPYYWIVSNSSIVTELVFRDLRFALIYTLFIIVAIFKYIFRIKFNFSRNEVFIYTFFITSYIVWLLKFSIFRYLLPLENITGLVLITILLKILYSKSNVIKVSACTFLLILFTSTTIYPNWGRYDFKNNGYGYFRLNNIPLISNDSLVLMVGGDAMSFLIPQLDPSIRFVSLKNNFFDINSENKMSKKVRDIIKNHNGKIYSMSMTYHNNDLLGYTDSFGLTADTDSCAVFKYAMGDAIKICELVYKVSTNVR